MPDEGILGTGVATASGVAADGPLANLAGGVGNKEERLVVAVLARAGEK